MKLHRLDKILLVMLAVTLLLSLVFSQMKNRTHDIGKIARKVQKDFFSREKNDLEILDEVYDDYIKRGDRLFRSGVWIQQVYKLHDEGSRAVMFSSGDSIVFLSHNAIPLTHNQLPKYRSGIVQLNNGWYYIKTRTHEDITIWLFSLVKKEYRYKNKFLDNAFEKNYSIPSFTGIEYDSAGEGISIYNRDGDYVCSVFLHPDQTTQYDHSLLQWLSIITGTLALGIFLSLLFLWFSRLFNKGHPALAISGLLLSLVVVRMLMFFFQQPFVFYEGDLFTARHFASSYWLPSLGDLFTNVMFAVLFSWFLFFQSASAGWRFQVRNFSLRYLVSFLLIVILAFSAYIVLKVLQSLVIHSSLHLNVQFIFDPDIYHIIGFLILTGSFLVYYFAGIAILRYLSKEVQGERKGKRLLVVYLVIAISMFFLLKNNQYVLWLLIFSSSFLVLFKQKDLHGSLSLSRLLFSFLVFALLSTYGLFMVNQQKELATRQNVSLRIASEQDPVAEFLFNEIENDIFDDYFLTRLILNYPHNEEEILEYIKGEYFSDFWNKYDIQITLCHPTEKLVFGTAEEEMACDDFFAAYAGNFGKPTLSSRLHYLDNNTGRNSYLAIIPIQGNRRGPTDYTLYIEFESKFIPKELGFPELLVDEQINITRNLGNYSYAIYKNGLMTNKYGSYFYNINVHSYEMDSERPFVIFEADGYSHLLYNRDPETRIIVSRPRETLLEKIAPFSYLFIFFLIYGLITWIIAHYIEFGWKFSFNFKKRLQATILGIVLISVVAIGSASAWFIFNIYKNKNESFVNEKAHSVLIELENNLAQESFLDETYTEYLNHLLLNLSHVFFTDINIFTSDGNLLSSSRAKVFDEGLISPIIDPIAYNNLKVKGKSLFIHNERIGNLEYISAYIQIRNVEGNLIAYVNLPYFAQQSELRNEISYFLVAFINIYLLLLLLSVVIAYFISNHVTRPLQVIRDSFARLSIGKTNEKINWNRDDEIGQLITEYNRMISELEFSAELLAKSERESAWREMAKQVAHEIKNPLTPMRLNVQYLQRAWNDKVDDWDERLARFTKTMVEQIDNLNIIAGEFSDFAKMPAANNDVIDLSEFIPEIPDLYKGYERVNINYELGKGSKPLVVYADRKQLLRVFNNLIKNAIQAYSRHDTARIMIYCRAEGDYCVMQIKDFGGGIEEDLKKNIFQPNFTTKTAGMGLGLAMVKSIIQSFNGHITFDSEKGKGTTFVIRIPLYREK
jgi:two-component system, NtrC family, nitrogen regulation sensor histidine kinase NtrY